MSKALHVWIAYSYSIKWWALKLHIMRWLSIRHNWLEDDTVSRGMRHGWQSLPVEPDSLGLSEYACWWLLTDTLQGSQPQKTHRLRKEEEEEEVLGFLLPCGTEQRNMFTSSSGRLTQENVKFELFLFLLLEALIWIHTDIHMIQVCLFNCYTFTPTQTSLCLDMACTLIYPSYRTALWLHSRTRGSVWE